jgi:chemotaxis protein methyltransferase CheR
LTPVRDVELTKEEFELFRKFIYNQLGISLSDYKISLLKSRLSKRLQFLKLKSFKEYYEYLKNDSSGEEIFMFINAVSTNVTSFFREPPQWDFLENEIKNTISQKKDKRLRIWSAACSSGEEPYSIIMFLKNHLPDFESWDIRILATDISKKVLKQAIDGIYEHDKIKSFPKSMIDNSFNKISNTKYQIKKELQDKITFRMFNLVKSDYSIFKNEFDLIYCRNVMIYFDRDTREQVVINLTKLIKEDGVFFLGSSESLNGFSLPVKIVSPAIYRKTNNKDLNTNQL